MLTLKFNSMHKDSKWNIEPHSPSRLRIMAYAKNGVVYVKPSQSHVVWNELSPIYIPIDIMAAESRVGDVTKCYTEGEAMGWNRVCLMQTDMCSLNQIHVKNTLRSYTVIISMTKQDWVWQIDNNMLLKYY